MQELKRWLKLQLSALSDKKIRHSGGVVRPSRYHGVLAANGMKKQVEVGLASRLATRGSNEILSNFVIAIDIRSKRNLRRIVTISKILAAMKLRHSIRVSFFNWIKPHEWLSDALNSPFAHMALRLTNETDLLITDRGDGRKSQKILRIAYDADQLSRSELGDDLFLPLLFHPKLIDREAYDLADKIAVSDDRPIGLLFAGNCDPDVYDSARIGKRYKLLNRIEIMRLTLGLEPKLIFSPNSLEEFKTAMRKGELRRKLVWINTKRFRLPASEWLDLLGKARFFLATPGVRYPYCHNLCEAAACGTVPVLQFPHFYRPALKPGRDCITFDSNEDFARVIDGVLKTSVEDWRQLSRAARDYHSQYLSLNALRDSLESFLAASDKMILVWHMAGKD